MTDDEPEQEGTTMNRIIESRRPRLVGNLLSLVQVRSGFRKTGAAYLLGHTAVERGFLNFVRD